jgi:hypothetical protein
MEVWNEWWIKVRRERGIEEWSETGIEEWRDRVI